MSSVKAGTAPDNQYAVVDCSDNSTVVYAGPCTLTGVHVQTALSAHACPITDNGTAIFTLPASAGGGSWFEGGNMRFTSDLTVDPNDSATGTITVVYVPDHEGLVGS